MADRVTLQAGVDLNDLRTIKLLMTVLAFISHRTPTYLDRATELVELVLTWQEIRKAYSFILKRRDRCFSQLLSDYAKPAGLWHSKGGGYALAHFWNGRPVSFKTQAESFSQALWICSTGKRVTKSITIIIKLKFKPLPMGGQLRSRKRWLYSIEMSFPFLTALLRPLKNRNIIVTRLVLI